MGDSGLRACGRRRTGATLDGTANPARRRAGSRLRSGDHTVTDRTPARPPATRRLDRHRTRPVQHRPAAHRLDLGIAPPRSTDRDRAARAARGTGDSLVHCDLYPHNILLSGDRVMFVDWPHARLGAPVIDLIALLTGMAADGIDSEPYLHAALPALNCPPASFDAILAAHTGFLMAGALAPMPAGLQAIAEEKLRLATAATQWLQHRCVTRDSNAQNIVNP
ncbi:phosphotransferase [Micromonospora sp. C51]|nr:phosphotransferase [Micromonospora sp. C51]